jgi:hypothetical protein
MARHSHNGLMRRWTLFGLAIALFVTAGSVGAAAANQWPVTVVAGAASSAGGVWSARANGTVAEYSPDTFFGDAHRLPLAKPITGMSATATGKGYWLAATDGGVFSYGDAHFYGSMGAAHLNQPIVGIASTKDGHGYWLVAADGGVFTFGDAAYLGSLGGTRLDQPIVGISATRSGKGYRLVARDGGVFTFGDATYKGSLGGKGLTDVLGLAPSPSGTVTGSSASSAVRTASPKSVCARTAGNPHTSMGLRSTTSATQRSWLPDSRA